MHSVAALRSLPDRQMMLLEGRPGRELETGGLGLWGLWARPAAVHG